MAYFCRKAPETASYSSINRRSMWSSEVSASMSSFAVCVACSPSFRHDHLRTKTSWKEVEYLLMSPYVLGILTFAGHRALVLLLIALDTFLSLRSSAVDSPSSSTA